MIEQKILIAQWFHLEPVKQLLLLGSRIINCKQQLTKLSDFEATANDWFVSWGHLPCRV